MDKETTRAWWRDALERLVWTFLQGAIAILTVNQFGLIELVDDELWKAAAAGGVGASLSLIKSFAATKLSQGDTAQLGAHTYSYTETGPGAAGPDL